MTHLRTPVVTTNRVPILIILLIFAYCVGGSIYKRHKFGSSGVESIPHIDLLRVLYARCVEMCCPSWATENSDRYKPLMDLSVRVHFLIAVAMFMLLVGLDRVSLVPDTHFCDNLPTRTKMIWSTSAVEAWH